MARHSVLAPVLAALCAAGLVITSGTAVAETNKTSTAQEIDWYNSTFTTSPIGPCPAETVTFHNGTAESSQYIYRFTPSHAISYADVTGEGTEDALFLLDCGPRNSEYTTGLIATTTDDAGKPRTLGTVVNPNAWMTVPADFATWYGDITVAMQDNETNTVWTEYYRWASSAQAFVRVDGQ